MRRRSFTTPGRTALLCLLAWGIVGAITREARAEHFDILLRLTGREGAAEGVWDTAPPEGGIRPPRQLLTAAAGEDLTLEWNLRSEFPHGTIKQVTIRILVVPQKAAGQRTLPPPGTPRVLESRFVADFLPHHSARGRLRFRTPEPGFYLVRLQSEFTEKRHGHEHFAALDLKVE